MRKGFGFVRFVFVNRLPLLIIKVNMWISVEERLKEIKPEKICFLCKEDLKRK